MPNSTVYLDQNSRTWSRDVIGQLPSHAGNVVGITMLEGAKDLVLMELDEYTQAEVQKSGVKLKENERVYRYATATTLAGKMMPLVKVNVQNPYLYFLTDVAIEHDAIEFSTRGKKLKFLRLVAES